MYYYDIHVFISRKNTYSVYMKSDKNLDEEGRIQEALKQGLINQDEANSVDSTDVLDEEGYQEYIDYQKQCKENNKS